MRLFDRAQPHCSRPQSALREMSRLSVVQVGILMCVCVCVCVCVMSRLSVVQMGILIWCTYCVCVCVALACRQGGCGSCASVGFFFACVHGHAIITQALIQIHIGVHASRKPSRLGRDTCTHTQTSTQEQALTRMRARARAHTHTQAEAENINRRLSLLLTRQRVGLLASSSLL